MVFPDKERLKYLSWVTLLGMTAFSMVVIYYLQHRNPLDVITGGRPYYNQLLAGAFFGSFSALLGTVLINIRRFRNVRFFFENLMAAINPSFINILFFSVCAGVGEEILFRATLQPIIGIWPAAIIFVLLHGYINPSNLNLTIYGIFLIVISAGFGYLFKFYGLLAAMMAHFIYDVGMFCVLKYAAVDRLRKNAG